MLDTVCNYTVIISYVFNYCDILYISRISPNYVNVEKLNKTIAVIRESLHSHCSGMKVKVHQKSVLLNELVIKMCKGLSIKEFRCYDFNMYDRQP